MPLLATYPNWRIKAEDGRIFDNALEIEPVLSNGSCELGTVGLWKEEAIVGGGEGAGAEDELGFMAFFADSAPADR